MMKVSRLRIYPNKSQLKLINETLSCCRYIQNKYIEYNQRIYEEEKRFISGYDFSKIINKLKKNDDNFKWINNYSSKAIKDAIMNEEKAFKSFFKKGYGYPKFKSRKRLNHESFFFIKDNIRLTPNKRVIKLPILGKIRITDYKSIPNLEDITSGRIIREYDKYYVSFIYKTESRDVYHINMKVGIDVGIKNYGTIYWESHDCFLIPHFKDQDNYKKYKNEIIKLQMIMSNKANINYNRLLNQYIDKHNGELPDEKYKNIMKGESYNTSNIRRIRKKIRRCYYKLNNIRTDYINKLVYNIVAIAKTKIITIEDLSISNMLTNNKNHKLHSYISDSGFYSFREKLINKCHEYNTEIRLAKRYFKSSKTCYNCGHIKKDLSLNDRVYKCKKCGIEVDRDINAAINLCFMKKNDFINA